jgi:hypothetical protein
MSKFKNEHQNRIYKRAMKNPLEAYFTGGFDLLPDDKKQETRDFLDNLGKKDS